MKVKKPVFAVDYIDDTVDIYERRLNASLKRGSFDNEVNWAFDVLSAYFTACAEADAIKGARAKFARLPKPATAVHADAFVTSPKSPYDASNRTESSVSYDEFLKLAMRRRSIRWFQSRPVEREKIDKMIDAARLSPTACNRLPYRFIVLDDRELASKAAKLAGGTGGFADQIPVLIVVAGDLSSYFSERDRHLIYIDASLASMSLMLAAETLGLSTCPINWSDVESRERGMYSLLKFMPEHVRPIMLIGVGYAENDGKVPFSSKKEITTLRSFNFENL